MFVLSRDDYGSGGLAHELWGGWRSQGLAGPCLLPEVLGREAEMLCAPARKVGLWQQQELGLEGPELQEETYELPAACRRGRKGLEGAGLGAQDGASWCGN